MYEINPDGKVYGANMGPIWDQQDPGGPHVGPMDLAIWEDWFLSNGNEQNVIRMIPV